MTHRRRPTMGSSSAGFSLLELLIAFSLVLLVLLLASGLLRESGLLFLEQRRAALDPFPELAVARLRADIQRSRGVAWTALSGPEGNPLTLALRGEMVRWRERGGSLERELLTTDGSVTSQQTILTPIAGWNWSSWDGCLIDVTLRLERRDWTPRWTAPGPQPARLLPQALGARVSCRDRPGGTW